MRLLRRWISCFLGSDSLIGLQFFRSPFIVTTFADNRCAGEADVKHIPKIVKVTRGPAQKLHLPYHSRLETFAAGPAYRSHRLSVEMPVMIAACLPCQRRDPPEGRGKFNRIIFYVPPMQR